MKAKLHKQPAATTIAVHKGRRGRAPAKKCAPSGRLGVTAAAKQCASP